MTMTITRLIDRGGRLCRRSIVYSSVRRDDGNTVGV